MRKKTSFIPVIPILVFMIAGQCFADVSAKFKQAQTHQEQGQHEYAEQIYKQIVRDHPVTDDALQAQKNLAILYVDWDKQPQAQAALQELIGNFSKHKDLPTAVTYVADAYRKLERHEKACEIYQYVVDKWPEDEHAMWSQMGLVISNTCLGNNNSAEKAFKKLCSDYSGYELLAKAICLVADNYRRLERYEKACELYQRALDNKPDVESALWSLMGLAISHIGLGDFDAAGAAVDKLLDDFTEYDRISIATCMIADEYRKSNKYEEASGLYRYVINKWPDAEHALWSHMGLGISNLRLSEEFIAQQAVEKLRTDFAEDERMATAGCLIGDEYRSLEMYGEACELYQYVVDKWPDTEKAMWSQTNMGNIKLELGDENAARAIFDKVLADFAGHPVLPKAVDLMAYGYYRKALSKNKEGLDELAKWYYQKTITECERIVNQLPETDYTTAEACYFCGICYDRLGQHKKAMYYYRKVVDNWPSYKDAWVAQLRIAKIYKRLLRAGLISDSEADAAISVAYKHLVEKFPDCPAAERARNWPNYNARSKEGEPK